MTLVLFMCTANQCRSPMAEVLAQAAFDRRGLDMASGSAGELPGGQPATENAERAMAARGLDLTNHVSRTVDGALLRAADLILTMERRHLGSIAELDLDAVTRAFPFHEFVRSAPPRAPQMSVEAWVRSVSERRDPIRVLAVDTADDVEDPIGRSFRRYRRCAQTLSTSVDDLVDLFEGQSPGE